MCTDLHVYVSLHSLVLYSSRQKLSANVVHCITSRLLSVSETAIALRPFIFSVHPDLFGKFPKEQVVVMVLTCIYIYIYIL